MGIRAYSISEAAEFIGHIMADPTAKKMENTSEWELFRYYREDTDEQGRGFGCYSYGVVYRNKKGRVTYTGLAEEDYRKWKDL